MKILRLNKGRPMQPNVAEALATAAGQPIEVVDVPFFGESVADLEAVVARTNPDAIAPDPVRRSTVEELVKRIKIPVFVRHYTEHARVSRPGDLSLRFEGWVKL